MKYEIQGVYDSQKNETELTVLDCPLFDSHTKAPVLFVSGDQVHMLPLALYPRSVYTVKGVIMQWYLREYSDPDISQQEPLERIEESLDKIITLLIDIESQL